MSLTTVQFVAPTQKQQAPRSSSTIWWKAVHIEVENEQGQRGERVLTMRGGRILVAIFRNNWMQCLSIFEAKLTPLGNGSPPQAQSAQNPISTSDEDDDDVTGHRRMQSKSKSHITKTSRERTNRHRQQRRSRPQYNENKTNKRARPCHKRTR